MSAESLSQKYQHKTEKQHVLDNPDSYLGSSEQTDSNMWVFNNETNQIQLKNIKYIPALYKLFDEIIVNSYDHSVRMKNSNQPNKNLVTKVDVSITEDGQITVNNDGQGIDVAVHPETKIYIPEMIFGNMRTSTNYNKDEKKITGGKNGFGVKLVFIWSSYARIETVDSVRKLRYIQEFKNNLSEICPPVITKVSSSTKPFVSITFKPDYQRLDITGLNQDMIDLFKKRAYDISAIINHSNNKVKISYNDTLIHWSKKFRKSSYK